jgi:hypothetical protein
MSLIERQHRTSHLHRKHTKAALFLTPTASRLTMNSSAVSVPLTEALPWPSPPPSDGRLFLVCDSIETDGRFLLHTLCSQVLSSSVSQKGVFWVACGPWTDVLIATSLKKMGCEAAASYIRDSNKHHPLTIRSVPVDIVTRMEENADFDAELYVKELYHSIKSWTGGDWIVIDDASALATLVGKRLTYCFIMSLRALANKRRRRTTKSSVSIMVKCSHDYDMEIQREQDTTSVRAGGSRCHVDWVGAGGGGGRGVSSGHDVCPWERALVELADGIVNVEPLASGYSREAHGRLVFCTKGRGWGPSNNNKMLQTTQDPPSSLIPLVLNFTCQDTTVSAIRLTRPVTKKT